MACRAPLSGSIGCEGTEAGTDPASNPSLRLILFSMSSVRSKEEASDDMVPRCRVDERVHMEVRLVGASLPDDVSSTVGSGMAMLKGSVSQPIQHILHRRLPIRRKTVISFYIIGDCLKVILRYHIFMMGCSASIPSPCPAYASAAVFWFAGRFSADRFADLSR